MTLVLEIEYLCGVSFAALGPDVVTPEWPPQPDRVFSALVATWAARGEDAAEAKALEWLERQPFPQMIVSDAEPRTAPVVFVPPNDPRSERKKSARAVLPSFRQRQPRRFPAARPHEPLVRLAWPDAEPEPSTLDALKQLGHDTAYVGHSASLTRCRFILQDRWPVESDSVVPERSVYEGRFAELVRTFEAGHRPLPGALVRPRPARPSQRKNSFSDRWLILEHVGGDMPDLRASGFVSKAIRDALLSGYRHIGLADRIPEQVSGHARGGGPAQGPHVAIVPLSFTGFPHADGHVMGFGVIPPHDGTLLDDSDFRRALRAIAPIDDQRSGRVITVRPFSIELSPTVEPSRRSLDPQLYTRRSHIFATVTPIVLDRHLKEEGDARSREIEEQIAVACINIGLPEPIEIVIHKHSAFEGAPSARPSGNAPLWMHWRLPPALASRQLVHAVIRFDTAVDGPVLLGAGRFVGIGLCRPLEDRQ